MSQRTVRSLTPEIRNINASTHEVDYVASDATVDCYQEIVVPRGVDFSRFQKNAPFVNSHDYHDVRNLLGRVIDFRVEGDAVIERVRFAVEESELAALAFRLTEGGYLRAVSVGFMTLKYAWSGSKEFQEMVKELGLSADVVAQCQCIHREWQQIELSACIIGANPNALVKSFKDGVLKERDIAMLGFGADDDFSMLEQCAKRYDGADPLLKVFIQRELERCHRSHRTDQSSTQKQRSTQQHPAPGGDAEAIRQAEKRKAEEQQQTQELLTALKAVPRFSPSKNKSKTSTH